MRLLALLLLAVCLCGAKYECRPQTPEGLQALGKEGMRLVFFASWCLDCKKNLLAAKTSPDKYILVATFEEKKAAETMLAALAIPAPCYFDKRLDKHFGVDSLPHSLTFKGDRWQR